MSLLRMSLSGAVLVLLIVVIRAIALHKLAEAAVPDPVGDRFGSLACAHVDP